MDEKSIINYQSAEIAVPQHSRLAMLLVCIAMSFVCAIAFVVVMTLTLPPSDRAYRQMPFQDPVVVPVMCSGAAVAGTLAFPFYYVMLRRRPLLKASAIVAAIVLAEILIVTPFNSGMGMIGSLIALSMALIVARAVLAPLNAPTAPPPRAR